jgi:hypothetical protein
MVFIKRRKGDVWGPRAKICRGPRATLIRPWLLVGSSCGFNANWQRSKESSDDSTRRRNTGAAQTSSVKYGAPGPIIALGPRWTTITPLRRQTFYRLANLYLPVFLELGHRIRNRTRRDTSLMLGCRADIGLHTPARERRSCS